MPVIWFTGLSGAGKTTIAEKLAGHIDAQVVDGDVIRRTISSDLKHGKCDRKENLLRVINHIKSVINKTQFVIASFVSPEKAQREFTKSQFEEAGINFHEIYIKASLQTCEERDVKGLYARFRQGDDISLAGLTEEYEQPDNPILVCDTDAETPEECVARILAIIENCHLI